MIMFNSRISDLFRSKFEKDVKFTVCRNCGGKGYVLVDAFLNLNIDAVECINCKGKGYIVVENKDNLPEII